MKLTEDQLQAIFEQLGVGPKGREIVRTLRSSPPARRVNGAASTTGRFPSRKMGLTIQYEARESEAAACALYESDPNVIEFYDQPYRLIVPFTSPGSTRTSLTHTPDFFVIRKIEEPDGNVRWQLVFEEWKSERRVRELATADPQRWMQLPSGAWTQAPIDSYLEEVGLEYSVNLTEAIPTTLVRNETLLRDYREKEHVVAARTATRVSELVWRRAGLSLADLLAELADVAVDDVLALYVAGELWMDEYAGVLTDHAAVRVYPSALVADRIAGPALPVQRGEVLLEAGARVRFGEIEYEIQNVTPTLVFLGRSDGPGQKLARTDFETWAREGHIVGISNGRTSLATHLVQRLRHLPKAEERLQVLTRIGATGASATRTQRRWMERFRLSKEIHGDGFALLAPDYARSGNRLPRFVANAVEFADQFIDEQYLQPRLLSVRKTHALYLKRCQDEGVAPMGRTSFFARLKREAKARVARRRWGDKAGHGAEMRSPRTSDLPIAGDRAFERVHIDHTELDLELCDSVTGAPLGRPWLTLAVDAYSRRILAFVLLFSEPSSRTLLLIARELVRRHGRLPQVGIMDHGKEFESTYFQTVMAAFGVDLQSIITGRARQNGPVEAGNKQVQADLIWNLVGNTKIRKNVRKMSPRFDPKHVAVWTLRELYKEIDRYAAWHENQTIRALGGTPLEIFNRSLQIAGSRPERLLVFDASFRALTAFPGPRNKGTAIVTQKGVKVGNIYYMCEAFRRHGVEGSRVEVRYEPLDASTAYAKVDGRWEICKTEFRELAGVTELELVAASQELRKRLSGDPDPLAIATFLAETQRKEAALLQAREDAERKARKAAEQRGLLIELNPLAPGTTPEAAIVPTTVEQITIVKPEGYEAGAPAQRSETDRTAA